MKEENKSLKSPADYDYLKASSVQDCTGLIPSGITYEEEIENYEDLYPFLPYPTKKLLPSRSSSTQQKLLY